MSPRETSFGNPNLIRQASKRRARRRVGQSGAVMFIVAMTLAVIAAMGVYALQIASTEIKTAGFIRQQVQTQYLSEYGVAATSQALTNYSQTYVSILTTPSMFSTGCVSLYGSATLALSQGSTLTPQAAACQRQGATDLANQVVQPGQPAPVLLNPTSGLSMATDGTLAIPGRGVVGMLTYPDFFVEVTDPSQHQPPPGYASNSNSPVCFMEVTTSAVGLTPSAPATVTSSYQTEGFEMSRARIMFGPVTCSGTK